MSVLPSPIPHPLDFSPWDLPGWCYEALEWVVGFDWPEGNEKETWDVADGWYAAAQALAGPHDEAFDAAGEVVAGYGGVGLTAEAFTNAWAKLSDGDDAPLVALLTIAHELGKLCEETGCEIEGAKIEAWIELGIFVAELLALAVTVVLTLGAASPAAAGIIAATRLAIQQIFKRLVAQLGKKALKKGLKEAGERAAKQLGSKAGLRKLGAELLDEGFDEAREEFAVNLGIQAYQNSTGRRDGYDLGELGMSTWGGFAGGAAAGLAGVGGHGGPWSGVARGASGEVLGEMGGSLATGGGLPGWDELGRAATSGLAGSAVSQGQTATSAALNGQLAALSGLPSAPPDLAAPQAPGPAGDDPLGAGPASGVSAVGGPSSDGPSSGGPSSGGPASGGPSSGGPVASPVRAETVAASAEGAAARAAGPVFSSGPEVNLATAVVAEPTTAGPVGAGPGVAGAGVAGAGGGGGGVPGGATIPQAGAVAPVVTSPVASAGPASVTSAPVASAPLASPPVASGPAISTAGPGVSPSVGSGPSATPSAASQPAPSTQSPPSGAPSTAAGHGAGSSTNSNLGTSARAAGGGVATAGPAMSAPVTHAPLTGTAASPPAPGPPSPAPQQTGPSAQLGPLAQPGPRPEGPAAEPGPSQSASDQAGSQRADERRSVAPGPTQEPGSTAQEPQPEVMPVVGPSAAASGPPRDGGSPGSPSPSLLAELDRLERAGYRDYAAQQRAEYERTQREDRAAHLRAAAANHRLRANDLMRQEIEARRAGLTVRADYLDAQAGADTRAANELEDEAYAVLDGSSVPPRTEVDGGRDWDRINDDVGRLAPGGVRTGGVSALTGSDHPPSVDTTRRYGERGGSRPPLAAHQEDLERAMPRDAQGNVLRTADPRLGGYFGLSNDGGPQADPTRAINCLDCVLSFYDTWVHGRPRVSAPRTFDAYANGDPTLPMDGEADGPGRVEDLTGGRYQNLCPDVGHLPPAQAHQVVDQAMNNLHQQLLHGGHGSFAFVITAWEGGSSHAWAAINQNGTILYVDPQSGHIRENAPLYGHFGQPYDGNVIMMDALVTGPDGAPLPLANHPTGAWSARPPITSAPTPPNPNPTFAPAATSGPHPTDPTASSLTPAGEIPPDPETGTDGGSQAEPSVNDESVGQGIDAQAEQLRLLDGLRPDHRAALEMSIHQAGVVAAAVSADLHGIVGALDPVEGQRAQIVDEQHRVKGLASLARKFTDTFRLYGTAPEEFLGEVNDRVRFSVQTPQHDYGRSVRAVLDQLRNLGYQIDVERDVKNFWQPGNRHNGVNVTARTPDGFTIEVQFPTEASRAAGKRTHALYEIVRLADATPTARVEALLDILRLNRESGISRRAPEGLDRLPAPVDTTFARWVQRNPEVWNRYQETLASEGRSFAEAVAQRGLGIEDFPGGERLGLQGGGAGVQLSRGVQAGQGPGSGEPDRGVGLGGPAFAGGPMEPSGPGVDLRSGDSGSDDLRRPTLRPGLPGGPVGGGADRPGEPGSRPAHRGAPAGDLRGGQPAGSDIGPAYVPADRSDEELEADCDPTPRSHETVDQAAYRADQAAQELDLREFLAVYEALGDAPPLIRFAEHDGTYPKAHTVERHGPDIAVWRSPGVQTLEGRIYGDEPWPSVENWSYGWMSEAVMNRVVNQLLTENWEAVRSDLAMTRQCDLAANVGMDVGQGFYNRGMYGAGPVEARYSRTSFVRIRIRLVPNSDPPEMFVLTAFPVGVL